MECRSFQDPNTGVMIRQVTDHPSIHHNPFSFVAAYDGGMRRLVFVSHRTHQSPVYEVEAPLETLAAPFAHLRA